jgi:hypothetical protein
LELSVLETGHGLLDQECRLLVDACTGYRSLSETGRDRVLVSR